MFETAEEVFRYCPQQLAPALDGRLLDLFHKGKKENRQANLNGHEREDDRIERSTGMHGVL